MYSDSLNHLKSLKQPKQSAKSQYLQPKKKEKKGGYDVNLTGILFMCFLSTRFQSFIINKRNG